VEGWFVPDSYLSLELEDAIWLGFFVEHVGIVQLRIATE